MKKFIQILLTSGIAILISTTSFAQINDPKKEAEEEGVKRINKNIDEGINKGFNKIEEGVGNLFNKKKKKKKGKESDTLQLQENKSNDNKSDLLWSRYDFIPGDKVIFEDNLREEENGEFPSRWDLYRGNAEVANFRGENVIIFMDGRASIIPYLKNSNQDYLPDIFTIEFDAWFSSEDQNRYYIVFHDLKNQQGNSLNRLICLPGGLKGFNSEETYSGMRLWDKPQNSFWRHVSIAFNTRSLKAYYDDERLINIPHLGFNPTGLTISLEGSSTPNHYMIKNIRIAEGGQKLYDRFLQDGKIIANGIRFDVNKATLKPESMGIINKIYDLMNDHPEVRFSVEGHTDSDGDDDSNQTLSENRAQTVVNTLISMGIDSNRLMFKGWGESKPLDTNATPEGKANNRRVEFVKL